MEVCKIVDWMKTFFSKPEAVKQNEFKRIIQEHLDKLIENLDQESPQFNKIFRLDGKHEQAEVSKDLATMQTMLIILKFLEDHVQSEKKGEKKRNKDIKKKEGEVAHEINSVMDLLDRKIDEIIEKTRVKGGAGQGDCNAPVSAHQLPVLSSRVQSQSALPGVRILNEENSCYIASAVSVLSTTNLWQYLSQVREKTAIEADLEELLRPGDQVHRSMRIRATIDQHELPGFPKYNNGTQEDAGEFLLAILTALSRVSDLYQRHFQAAVREYEKRCLRCNKRTRCNEDAVNITNPYTIQMNTRHYTVQTAIDDFLRPENNTFCEGCQSVNPTTTISVLTQVPNYLPVLVNRSKQNGRKDTQKILVDVEVEINKERYELKGFIHHYSPTGSANHGHYTSCLKASNNYWYKMDDAAEKQPLTEYSQRFLSEQASFLLYERIIPESNMSVQEEIHMSVKGLKRTMETQDRTIEAASIDYNRRLCALNSRPLPTTPMEAGGPSVDKSAVPESTAPVGDTRPAMASARGDTAESMEVDPPPQPVPAVLDCHCDTASHRCRHCKILVCNACSEPEDDDEMIRVCKNGKCKNSWIDEVKAGRVDVCQLTDKKQIHELAQKLEVYIKGRSSTVALQEKIAKEIFGKLIEKVTVEELKKNLPQEMAQLNKDQKKSARVKGALKAMFGKGHSFELMQKVAWIVNGEIVDERSEPQATTENTIEIGNNINTQTLAENRTEIADNFRNELPLSQQDAASIAEETVSTQQRQSQPTTRIPVTVAAGLLMGQDRVDLLEREPLKVLYRKYVKDEDTNKENQQLRNTIKNRLFDALVKTNNPAEDRKNADKLLMRYSPQIEVRRDLDRKRTQLKTLIKANEEALQSLIEMLTRGGLIESSGTITAPKFCLPNEAAIVEKRQEMAELRRLRNETLKNGGFEMCPEGMANPLLDEAGQRWNNRLDQLTFSTCVNCHERRINNKLGPVSQKCEECSRNRVKYSAENNMDPGDDSVVPPELRDLTLVEQAAISQICPVQHICYHPGGQAFSKGSSLSFQQDVQSLVDKLPRPPEDVGVIVLKPPGASSGQKATSQKILNALRVLKQINPYYKHITIDEEALQLYPDNYVEDVNLPSIDVASMEEQPGPPGQETLAEDMPNLDDVMVAENMEEEEEERDERADGPTMIDAPCPVSSERSRINTALWPERKEELANEFAEGFFTKAFPCLFPTGNALIVG